MLCCMLSSLKIFLEEDGSSSRYGEFSATSKISVFPPPFLQALNMFDSFAHKMLLLSIFSVKGAFIATQHSVLSNNSGNFEAAKLMPKIAQGATMISQLATPGSFWRSPIFYHAVITRLIMQ